MEWKLGSLDASKILTIILYSIIIVVIVLAVLIEKQDLSCANHEATNCGPGKGKAYACGIPKKDDSYEELLEKVKVLASYDLNSIHWRRIFIAAAISAFFVLYIYNSRAPTGIELVSGFLVIYIIFYVMTVFFQNVVANPALKHLDKILEQLKKAKNEKR